MSDKDDRILNKLDDIESHIASIDVTLAKQEVSLTEHVRRSDALEDLVSEIREKEINPLKETVNQFKGMGKLLIYGASVIAALLGILKLFGKI